MVLVELGKNNVPTEFNECSFETISLIVRAGKLSYLVLELYRPPSGNLNDFCQQFITYLDVLNAEKVTSIIIGTDQNMNYDFTDDCNYVDDLEYLFNFVRQVL